MEILSADAPQAHLSNTLDIPGSPFIVITYPYPLGEASGGARMTREIARHLSRSGARVVVLPISTNGLSRGFPRSPIDEKLLGYEYDESLAKDSVEIIRVPQNPLYFHLDGLSVKKILKKIFKQQKVDLVLSYFHEGAFIYSWLQNQDVKFGYIATWITYERLKRKTSRNIRYLLRYWWYHFLIIKPYRKADIIFATSKHTRNQIINIVGVNEDRVRVCYLGINPSFIEIPRNQPRKICRFLFFGRVVPVKGFVDALEALGKLHRKGFRNWSFRIVGEGRLERAKAIAQDLGIGDKVAVCQAVNDAGLLHELEQAHLAILPSYREAFGLAFAEAQAAGIPVIAYHAGSVPEIIKHGFTGWLAPYRKVDKLAEYIEQAIKNPVATYRAGLAGREQVKRLFTWEKTAKTILQGLQDIETNFKR